MDQAELAKAMAAQNDITQRLLNQNSELRERVLELEQKATRGFGGGERHEGEGVGEIIMRTLEGSESYKALLRDEAKSARINIPAAAFFQHKAVITSTITGGTIGEPDRSPRFIAPAEQRLRIRDLVPAVQTDAGSTQFIRELVYTNSAGPQYDTSSPTPGQEGATKPASDMTFELVTATVTTVAHSFTVSRQALADSPGLRQQIESRGVHGLKLEEDRELLNGTGTNGELTGLLTSATTFNGGVTNANTPDTLRRAINQLALSNHVANGIVMHPTDVMNMELLKDSEGRYLAVVAFVNGQPIVWRVPIVETVAIAQGTFLAGAFDMAATIRDRQQATVEVSLDHADYRTRNLALILIEERLGLEIHRPIALVSGNVSHAG